MGSPGRRRQPVPHRRPGAVGAQRGLHRRLRPAQRKRLCRDLRGRRPGVLGPAGCSDCGCDRRFADVLERALYNGALSGVSLDGGPLLLREPAQQPRRPPPPGLVRLRLLPAQPRAAARLARRLHLLRRRGRDRAGTSTATAAPRRLGGAGSGWRRRSPLSLGRRVRLDGDVGRPATLRGLAARPRLGQGASLAVTARGSSSARSSATAMRASSASRRSGDHVDRTCRWSARSLGDPLVRRTPAGRTRPRAAGLLPRGCETAAPGSTPSRSTPFRRRPPPPRSPRWGRGHARPRRAARRRRLGRHAPPRDAARRAADRARFVRFSRDNRGPGELLVWVRSRRPSLTGPASASPVAPPRDSVAAKSAPAQGRIHASSPAMPFSGRSARARARSRFSVVELLRPPHRRVLAAPSAVRNTSSAPGWTHGERNNRTSMPSLPLVIGVVDLVDRRATAACG